MEILTDLVQQGTYYGWFLCVCVGPEGSRQSWSGGSGTWWQSRRPETNFCSDPQVPLCITPARAQRFHSKPTNRIGDAVPQLTEWQCIGDQRRRACLCVVRLRKSVV